MEHWNKIESYIHGELEGEDLGAFLEAMAKDPDLQREVDRQGKLVAGLEGMRLREHVRRHKVVDRQVRRPVLAIWASAAAAVAALVVFGLWMYQSSPIESADRSKEPRIQDAGPSAAPHQEGEGMRSARDGAAGDLIAGVEAPRGMVVSAKVKEVYHDELKRFEIPDQDLMGDAVADQDLVEDLQRAFRSMQDEDPARALRILESMESVSSDWYQEDVDWMTALCLLLQDPDQGKRRLEAMANDPTHSYRIRALQVLGKLGK